MQAAQIHHTGESHWVITVLSKNELHLLDSMASTIIPPLLEKKLAKIYANFCTENSTLNTTRQSIQQQNGGLVCGAFAIAFGYHWAQGDNLQDLALEQDAMRDHLLKCLESQKLMPFPTTTAPVKRCRKYNIRL